MKTPQIYRRLWNRGYRPVLLRPKAIVNALRRVFGLQAYRELGTWVKVD